MDWAIFSNALLAIAVLMVAAWCTSLWLRDVSIVDALWSLMFLIIAGMCFWQGEGAGHRPLLVLTLVMIWSVRLSGYIAVRNHGQPEDRRYQEIRRNNSPGFEFKSLYIVFGLQALLAWIIAMPLAVSLFGSSPLGWLDALALVLWLVGMGFETVGDAQLSRFKNDPANRNRVLSSGLWRLTRHPNYFGEFMLWWGYYLFAVAAGGWWTIASPLLMSVLLLKVSGVRLLEKDISGRRPDYVDYVARTNAFFPGPQKAAR